MSNADASYESEVPSQVFSRRVREVRRRRDWTQAKLAERLTEIGRPTTQATVARIESQTSTRARNVSIDEAFAFAAALGVSPLYLLLPLTRDERIAIGHIVVSSRRAREWLKGVNRLLDEDDLHVFMTERDPDALRDLFAEIRTPSVVDQLRHGLRRRPEEVEFENEDEEDS